MKVVRALTFYEAIKAAFGIDSEYDFRRITRVQDCDTAAIINTDGGEFYCESFKTTDGQMFIRVTEVLSTPAAE